MSTQQTLAQTGPAPERAAVGGEWVLDAGASRLQFAAKTLWGLMTVRGQFTSFEGTAHVVDDGSVAATLAVDAGSVDTGLTKRDAHLRSAAFLDATVHPQMAADIGVIHFTGAGAARAKGKLVVAGRTQPVTFDARVSLPTGGQEAVVEASLEVDLSRLGMTRGLMHMVRPTTRASARLVFRKGPVLEAY